MHMLHYYVFMSICTCVKMIHNALTYSSTHMYTYTCTYVYVLAMNCPLFFHVHSFLSWNKQNRESILLIP